MKQKTSRILKQSSLRVLEGDQPDFNPGLITSIIGRTLIFSKSSLGRSRVDVLLTRPAGVPGVNGTPAPRWSTPHFATILTRKAALPARVVLDTIVRSGAVAKW